MGFMEDLEAIDLINASNTRTVRNKGTVTNATIDQLVLHHLNTIKSSIRRKASHDFYYYDLNAKEKIIYGKLDLCRYKKPTEGLFSFMYKYNGNDEIRLTDAGKKVYNRLQRACESDNITIKIGRKMPHGNTPNELRDWYVNSLYSNCDNISHFKSPYQVYVGYRISRDMTAEEVENVKEQRQKENCYIATCAYGSYDCPELWTLRRFRDFFLRKTWYGRAFIRFYYSTSPTLVKYFGGQKRIKQFIKTVLNLFVGHLHRKGYDDNPYDDYPY